VADSAIEYSVTVLEVANIVVSFQIIDREVADRLIAEMPAS
jgi:hypothetical protein